MGNVERHLRRLRGLEESLTPPAPSSEAGPSIEELPVEQWVAEHMADSIPEANLQNTTDEEFFYKWLEQRPRRLCFDILLHEAVEAGVRTTGGLEEVVRRIVDALPPYLERWHQLWVEHLPARERRRRWMAEMDRSFPRSRTRENGYGWWLNTQQEYARLRSKYAGWEEEWRDFYSRWAEGCERPQGNTPLPDEMADELIRICFQRDVSEPVGVSGLLRLAMAEVYEEAG